MAIIMRHAATVEARESFQSGFVSGYNVCHRVTLPAGQARSEEQRSRWLIEAFEVHRAELHTYILRKMGSVEEAEELTQDVFVRLMRYEKPESINNLQAFLFTTANNIVRDRIRRLHARRHNMHDTIDNVEIDSGLCLEHRLEAAQCANALTQALGELSDEHRRALMLHRLECWTHAQIAEELNTTVGVVRRYISLALSHCRERIESAASSSQGAPVWG